MVAGKRYLLEKGVKKRYALSDMKYDEISFVARGANEDARVVLWKSAEKELGKTGPLPEDLHVNTPDWGIPKKRRKKMTGGRGNTATTRNVECPVCAHKMSVSKSAECTCGVIIKNEGPGQPVDVVETGILSTVLKLGNDIVGVVSEEDSTKADVVKVIQKFTEDVAKEVDDWLELGTEFKYTTGLDEDVEKLFTDAYETISGIVHSTEEVVEPVNKRRRTKVVKTTPEKVGSDDPVELAKSLPEDSPIRKALEDVAGLRDEVSKMREKEMTGAWVEVAKSLQYVPGKPEEIGEELREVEKALGAEAAKKHLARMVAMNKIAKDSDLFKSRGSDRSGAPDDSALGVVGKKMAELKKSKNDAADTDLMEMVFTADPGLYERYIEEQG